MRKIRGKQSRKAERRRRRKFLPPGFGWRPLLLLALALSAPLTLRFAAHKFLHDHSSPLYAAKWKVYSPGESRLSLLLPGAPQFAGVGATDADPAAIGVARYQVVVGEFRVALWEISYREGTPADLRQASRGVASALREFGEVAEYQENFATTRRYGREGLLVRGEYKRGGGRQLFSALLTGEGAKLWQTVVSYPASDRLAASASRRVLDSVRLN